MSVGLLPDAPAELPGLRVADEAEARARGCSLVIGRHQGRLALWAPTERAGALYVDFSGGALGYRLAAERYRHERLVRAIGGLPGAEETPSIIDATAGLGRDAALLAGAGYQVTLFEREPVIHALLADGLERARRSLPELAVRLELCRGDCVGLIGSDRCDGVYLDPMFPPRRKSAKIRKELRWLQELEPPVGPDEEPALLEAALQAARSRVVVKRPLKAAPLAGRRPAHQLNGRTVRFDVYVA